MIERDFNVYLSEKYVLQINSNKMSFSSKFKIINFKLSLFSYWKNIANEKNCFFSVTSNLYKLYTY